jgi:hypothetical protein
MKVCNDCLPPEFRNPWQNDAQDLKVSSLQRNPADCMPQILATNRLAFAGELESCCARNGRRHRAEKNKILRDESRASYAIDGSALAPLS